MTGTGNRAAIIAPRATRSTWKRRPLGSAEFFAECTRIAAIAEAKKGQAPKPGTLGGLVNAYFQTEHFGNLADATKRDYRKCADFLHPIRDTPGFRDHDAP